MWGRGGGITNENKQFAAVLPKANYRWATGPDDSRDCYGVTGIVRASRESETALDNNRQRRIHCRGGLQDEGRQGAGRSQGVLPSRGHRPAYTRLADHFRSVDARIGLESAALGYRQR